MHKKLTEHKAYHRRLVKRRSATVEPVLGTLINYHSMKKLNSRGMAQANKHILMAALTYNLKKLLNFNRPKPKWNYQVLEIEAKKALKGFDFLFLRCGMFYTPSHN